MRNLKKQKTKNNIVINPNLVIEFAFLNCMMTQDWYITDACFAAVLLEFYAPSHKDCKELASVFEDLAISYQRDPDVIIAKFDIFANDLLHDFEIWTLPTVYFKSADGNISPYTGYATKEDLRDFIEKNRFKIADEHLDMNDEL